MKKNTFSWIAWKFFFRKKSSTLEFQSVPVFRQEIGSSSFFYSLIQFIAFCNETFIAQQNPFRELDFPADSVTKYFVLQFQLQPNKKSIPQQLLRFIFSRCRAIIKTERIRLRNSVVHHWFCIPNELLKDHPAQFSPFLYLMEGIAQLICNKAECHPELLKRESIPAMAHINLFIMKVLIIQEKFPVILNLSFPSVSFHPTAWDLFPNPLKKGNVIIARLGKELTGSMEVYVIYNDKIFFSLPQFPVILLILQESAES